VGFAFLWTVGGGMVSLGTLAGGATSAAYGISADGLVIVGASGSSSGQRAFRWTDPAAGGGGMVSLGTLSGGASSIAYAVSDDGAVVVGASGSSSGERAFRWSGAMASLGTLSGGTVSRAFGVSGDGAVVVGFSRTSARERAFSYSGAGPMQVLGALPEGISFAYGASADGTRIIGRSTLGLESHAVLWTPEDGLVDLNTYLPLMGIDITGWQLQDARGISANGRTIAGNGIHFGSFEGYIVRLGAACPADFNGDGTVNSQDFFDFLGAFFADPQPASADFNGDGTINSQDFFDFLGEFLRTVPVMSDLEARTGAM
jgi:probable HAF family extracellular repeat protein